MAISCSLPLKGLNCFQTTVLIIELLIILTIFEKCVYSPNVEFVAHPVDLRVTEGGSGTFNCTLKSTLSFSAANSYWENGLTKPFYQSDSCNVTTTSNNITNTISSYFTINNVRRDMNKLYKCWIVLKITSDSPTVVSSEFASLDVLYFLKDKELHCRGPSDQMLQEGDQATVECESKQTNPQAVLRWLRPINTSSSFTQTGSLLVGNITLTPSLHNDVLICIAESEAFPGEQVNCSLGPYTVIHSPIVEVVPHQAEIMWPSVTQMQFQCIARGYPQVKGYEWFCHPQELFAQCTSHSQNVTITLDGVETEETLNISCEATNEVATSRNYSNVHVRYMANIDDCKPNSKILPGIIGNGVPAVFYDDITDVLKCLTKVKSIMKGVTFQWYLDGLLIALSKGDHEVIKSSEGSSHLVVYNLLKLTRPGIVACAIRHKQYNDWSLDQLVTCKLSGSDLEDPSSSITHFWQGNSTADNESFSIGQRKYWTKFLIAIPIAVGFGLLFCLLLIIFASQKSTACRHTRRMETSTCGNGAPLTDGIRSSGHGSTSHILDGTPVYEIPDINLGSSLASRKSSTIPHFEPCRRRITVDPYMEEGEEGGEKGKGGEEGKEEIGGELFFESILKSEHNDSYSSVENQDISFLSDDTNDNDVPVLHNFYENREVVESIVGNTCSRYFQAKTTQSAD